MSCENKVQINNDRESYLLTGNSVWIDFKAVLLEQDIKRLGKF